MFKGLNIAQKMTLAIGAAFLCFIFAIGSALLGLQQTSKRLETFLDHDQVLSFSLNEMYAQGLQMGQALRNIILDADNQQAYQNLEAAQQAFEQAHERFTQVAAQDRTLLEFATRARQLHDQRLRLQADIVQLVTDDPVAATALLNEQETPTWRSLREDLLAMMELKQAEVEHTKQATLASVSQTTVNSLLFGLAALVIGASLM